MATDTVYLHSGKAIPRLATKKSCCTYWFLFLLICLFPMLKAISHSIIHSFKQVRCHMCLIFITIREFWFFIREEAGVWQVWISERDLDKFKPYTSGMGAKCPLAGHLYFFPPTLELEQYHRINNRAREWCKNNNQLLGMKWYRMMCNIV